MNYKVIINMPISNHEIPKLRELVGWGRRDKDFPTLFKRCNFWAGVRNKNNKLIAFGYVAGTGLEHGYMEDIIVHPDYQKMGIGVELVRELLRESERYGLEIVTLTYEPKHKNFYETCGFTPCSGGLWKKQ
ncbi:GNAT family N-acetyltransferase [Peribacillus muralis]|uniref:GNAT family N-acetyltransferase n=1 Tax=Peribacillus muralis TaxID=264697 RepID=UPI001F4E7CE2|nr:GNAT family N-acetyltransferase [Peribacillus muralis]MCK1995294.1 GNAT family N-acetyltransferase [Peribacillus muralis]MCK2015950.1 GNAT family N-acetyltransferase [Peribacillus muralis]